MHNASLAGWWPLTPTWKFVAHSILKMKTSLIVVLVLLTGSLRAQETMLADSTAVKSIDGIVKEVLRIISGESGKTRNWEGFRHLFLPTAKFTVHSHDNTNKQPVESVTLDEFIAVLQEPYYEQGFLEYEIAKTVDEYNGIAQVLQTYYSKDSEGHEEKGITCYQLVNYNDRWWIVSILWTGDSNGVPIPKKYLKK